MSTDFSCDNSTIVSSGPFKSKNRNAPLNAREYDSPSITGSLEGIVYYKSKLIMGHTSYKNFYIIDANI